MTEPAAGNSNPGRIRLWPLLSVCGAISIIALLVFGVITSAEDRSIDDALSRGSAPVAPEFDLEVLDIGAHAGKEAEAASGLTRWWASKRTSPRAVSLERLIA